MERGEGEGGRAPASANALRMSPRLAFFCGQKGEEKRERERECSGRGSRRGNGVTALRFPVDVRLCLSQDIELLKMAARAAAASSPASSPVCALSLLKLVKIV